MFISKIFFCKKKLQIPTISHIPIHLADMLLSCYEAHDINEINRCTEEILLHESKNSQTNGLTFPNIH